MDAVTLTKGVRRFGKVDGVSVEQNDFLVTMEGGGGADLEEAAEPSSCARLQTDRQTRWGTVCLESRSLQKLEHVLKAPTDGGTAAAMGLGGSLLELGMKIPGVVIGGFPVFVQEMLDVGSG
jgi:hypothetical protein